MFPVRFTAMPGPIISRQKLLDAAARVYAEHGFRGATTRRIADVAGVNEVTLFRLFRSKSALIDEALRSHVATGAVLTLPDVPAEPQRELAEWCAGQLEHLRAKRSLIRTTMGELEERPDLAPCIVEAPTNAFRQLRAYAVRLRRTRGATADARETMAAVAMLSGALFADAMGREMMPDLYPQPESRAPALYARLFLRALGVPEEAQRAKRSTAG